MSETLRLWFEKMADENRDLRRRLEEEETVERVRDLLQKVYWGGTGR